MMQCGKGHEIRHKVEAESVYVTAKKLGASELKMVLFACSIANKIYVKQS